MNSLNKHVPMLVFLLGLGFVIYAMRTFFHPRPLNVSPIAVRPLPTVRPALEANPVRPQPPRATTLSTVRPNVSGGSLVPPQPNVGLAASSARDQYLKKIGLKMFLPEDWRYREMEDGPIHILSAKNAAGEEGFFMFSGKGKYTADQARDYVLGYMSDGVRLNAPEPGQRIPSTSEMKDVTLFKGTSPEGFSYRMFYFSDPGGRSHMVLLMDSEENFKKNASKIQDTLNSIRRDR